MNTLQSLVMAVIQGLTEFLPISSTAHLQLPHLLFDWPASGLLFDVATHLGTLAAVLLYFRRELWRMAQAASHALYYRRLCADSRLLLMLACASLPVMLAGLAAQASISYQIWRQEPGLIALATALFALLLWRADVLNRRREASARRCINDMSWRDALIIGLFQVCALVPGTSRAGVSLSAGLLLGFERSFATRFAFLLAIPVILAATALELPSAYSLRHGEITWGTLAAATVLAGTVAYATIAWFMSLIERVGLLPFVVYRLALAALLGWLALG